MQLEKVNRTWGLPWRNLVVYKMTTAMALRAVSGTGRTYGQYEKLEQNKLRFFVAAEDNELRFFALENMLSGIPTLS